MPRKNLALFFAILLCCSLGLSRAFSEQKYYKEMTTFARILDEILNKYVTDKSAPEETQKLFEGAYRGMLMTLDPYSQYFNQKQSRSFAADTEGEFGGLGIEISLSNGILTIISPLRGTPAYDAGVMAGDIILEIDGKSTERISLFEAVNLLRGKPGTDVTLTVRHPGGAADSKIKITRAVIQPSSVEYEMIDKEHGIALMRITSFTAKVMDEMRSAVDEMTKAGLKSLILDLRQNPGGLLDKAVEMSDEFLSEGTIVSVKGRRPEQVKTFTARRGEPLEDLPLVLLVDEGSASASEIVAGALRDHRRALLVGARTYGKGSVQNVIPLGNGESLKLTTARYYTPKDKPILDRQGLRPDVFIPMSRDYLIALRNQEREDKVRGTYHIGGLLDLNNNGPKDEEAEEPAKPAPPDKEKPAKPRDDEPGQTDAKDRPERLVDRQLQAAYNILRWQLAGDTAAVSPAK